MVNENIISEEVMARLKDIQKELSLDSLNSTLDLISKEYIEQRK